MRASDMLEGFFTEGNFESFREQAKRTKVEFSASKESLGYLRFLLFGRIRRGALDGPKHHGVAELRPP
jgi:hypothetical protein